MKIGRNKSGDAARAKQADKTGAPTLGDQPFRSSPEKLLAKSDLVSIAGIPEAELTPKVRDALHALMSEVAALREQMAALRTRLRQAETLADQDPLLNIANRRAFVRDLERTLAMVARYDTKASLVFIDVNGLKKINDAHGHSAGDLALAHVATVISQNIRSGDSFGRLGGDEFGLILLNASGDIAADKIAGLADLIGTDPIVTQSGPISVSIAFGIVPLDAGLDLEHALARADQAMYAKK